MWYHLDFSSHFEHNNASSKFNVTPKYYLKKQKFLTHSIIQHNRIKSNKDFRFEICKEHLQNYITALINSN